MIYAATALFALSAPTPDFLVDTAPSMFGSAMVHKFTAWKASMGKTYATTAEEKAAIQAFESNDQIINILKGIIRQGQQAGANANMSAKRLFQMRSQGLLKSSYVTGAALRPLYVVISKTLKNLENSTLSQVRNNIIKASEEIERFK